MLIMEAGPRLTLTDAWIFNASFSLCIPAGQLSLLTEIIGFRALKPIPVSFQWATVSRCRVLGERFQSGADNIVSWNQRERSGEP